MPKPRSKSKVPTEQEWATAISALRHQFDLSQTAFGKKFHSSAMAVSRWKRGVQEPTARSYIEIGNLAGDPSAGIFGDVPDFATKIWCASCRDASTPARGILLTKLFWPAAVKGKYRQSCKWWLCRFLGWSRGLTGERR